MNRKEVFIIVLVIVLVLLGEAFLWYRSMSRKPVRIPGEPRVDSVIQEPPGR